MRFSISFLLLATLTVAAVLATTLINGIDTIPLLLPHALMIALALRLWHIGKGRPAIALSIIYIVLWLLTAFISPIYVKRTLAIEEGSTDISSLYTSNTFPPIVVRGISIETKPPWHYCRPRSSPCPLITVVDHGVLNEQKGGAGGRTWFLWLGNKSVPVRRASFWIQ